MYARLGLTVVTLAMLSACANSPSSSIYSQAALPDAVKVPAGNKVALEAVGVGKINYECREKANAAGVFEWAFVGPDAVLNSRAGVQIGKYYGPPATWESKDGSKVTGKQLAVAPSTAGNIPLQLVQANPATGQGLMTGVTYIQRVNTQGGVAPAIACNGDNKGKKEIVNYQADYIFYSAQ
jgi:hypothetical protein